MYQILHRCMCGEDWEATYPAGAVVDPACPNCDRRLEVVRPKRKAWYENISSKLRT